MKGITRMRHIATGLSLTLFCASPMVLADDTELYIGGPGGGNPNAGPPNILLILDTSGSMDTILTTQQLYDSAVTYTGTCDASRVYWSESSTLPDCAGDKWFNRTALMCAEANRAVDSAGFYTDLLAQFDDSPQLRWEKIDDGEKDRVVECRADGGIHGDGINGTALWARSGNSFPWSTSSNDQINWNANGRSYTVYHGNYLNWNANAPLVPLDRLEVVQSVTKSLIDSIAGVNVGLMRFDEDDTNGEGGPVIHAMEDIATARTGIKAAIDGLDHDGFTPLSETLYEAGLYYLGRPVDYGLASNPDTSVLSSRVTADPTLYKAPTAFACQKNFIVLLTDGIPTEDVSADAKIAGLPNFATLTGSSTGTCDINVNSDGTTDGSCLDDMADYMSKVDVDSGLPGQQNVTTHTVGFTVDLPILQSTANRGDGDYVLADDTVSLTIALSNLLTQIFEDNTAFSAPTVSVNAFNRTQNMNDLFISVFESSVDTHWPGNLKKYQVVDGQIVGEDMAPAVDPSTGFFKNAAQSFWGGIVDGAAVTESGAASQIPASVGRNVYTFTGSPATYGGTLNADLTTHPLTDGNVALTDAMLGIGLPGDPSRIDMIEFARGTDVTDENNNGNVTEPRLAMGDALHARPASVIYGGTVSNPDAVVYTATNNGNLHAIDPDTGAELWTFIPREVLGNLRRFYDNNPSVQKTYGIDGNLRTQVVDVDGNGIIDAGDKVYLFFGMRRGGDFYYGLDITDKNAPTLMWVKSSNELPDLGQTWSTPQVTRLDVAGIPQNANNFALIIGGGYDPSQDNPGYSTDSQGNSIYMLDAVTGDVLWRAGLTGSGADFEHPEMDNSIPSDVRVLDMNGDDFADRMYVGDMGGRLWRFDIFNGQDPANLVAGGVLASLGAADAGGSPPLSINRRLYNAPDVAPVATLTNGNYLHIGIGSGYRAHPLSSLVQDRFYSIRDRELFTQMSQAQYDAFTPVVDTDLIDITDFANPTVAPAAPGWKFELRDPTEPGEKVLSEARTLLGNVFFTTFLPPGGASGALCAPDAGSNRLYVVDINDGGTTTNFDRVTDLMQGGIAPTPSFFFIPDDPDPDNCVGAACRPELLGLIGVEPIQVPPLPPFFRTFWTQTGQIPAPPPPP